MLAYSNTEFAVSFSVIYLLCLLIATSVFVTAAAEAVLHVFSTFSLELLDGATHDLRLVSSGNHPILFFPSLPSSSSFPHHSRPLSRPFPKLPLRPLLCLHPHLHRHRPPSLLCHVSLRGVSAQKSVRKECILSIATNRRDLHDLCPTVPRSNVWANHLEHRIQTPEHCSPRCSDRHRGQCRLLRSCCDVGLRRVLCENIK